MKKSILILFFLIAAALFIFPGCEDEEEPTAKGDSGSFVDQRDGQEYEWVEIGDQIWMAENLNYDQSSHGSDWCYDNNSPNCNKYGRLYDWYAVMQDDTSNESNSPGEQGVCPDGWHVPGNEEWSELIDNVDDDGHEGTEAIALRASSGWSNEGNGTNIYGFSALPGGYRDTTNIFGNIGIFGTWWTSTESTTGNALNWTLYGSKDDVDFGIGDKGFGLSVRCVKD